MNSLANSSPAEIAQLNQLLDTSLADAHTLRNAAQIYTQELIRHFGGVLALSRLYVTFRMSGLPLRYSDFAKEVAKKNRVNESLTNRTSVMCLMGSSGKEQSWNDPYGSKGHLAIPLISATFVENIPMVARLLREVGAGLSWLDAEDSSVGIESLGNVGGLFYVQDASVATDQKGRKIVYAQDFVRQYNIKTVFGMGGSYVGGSLISLVLFCNESIEKSQAQNFMPLVNTFKSRTVSMMLHKKIF
jgi:hypothetical protein